MRAPLFAALLLATAVAAPAAAVAQDGYDFSGPWSTNQGDARFSQRGGSLRGTYNLSGGEVHAEVNGRVASGWWTQTTSNRRCEGIKFGTHYWGRMELIAQKGGDAFKGDWAYCEDALGSRSGGPWTGTRK